MKKRDPSHETLIHPLAFANQVIAARNQHITDAAAKGKTICPRPLTSQPSRCSVTCSARSTTPMSIAVTWHNAPSGPETDESRLPIAL
ncbi:hypothetical protein JCM18920_2445 [Cutibacterium acnes JCM 18920]|nr:hypothetical protein JCM18920_2445 [Cutibacterium acnes JCM 18920]